MGGAALGTYTVLPSVVPFSVYQGDNIVTSSFDRKLLVFPYGKAIDLEDYTITTFDTEENPVPKLTHAVAMNGRVFGVLDGKFYASEWNNYAGWNLNTAEETDTSLAWVSTTQSDADAGGDFTGVVCYDGHVIGFKRNFMHQIYNNKTPFRIVDIAKVGALSQAAICECNQILFFVGEDGVYAYTGGYPTRISDPLDINDFEGAVLGADERTLYCYLPSEVGTYTYDTVNGTWGALDNFGFTVATTVAGKCYAVKKDTYNDMVYSLCDQEEPVEFRFSSDLTMNGSLLEKRIKRIRLQLVSGGDPSSTGFDMALYDGSGRLLAKKSISNLANGNHVVSLITRTTCSYGHRLEVTGCGILEFRYLQIDYENGGERYGSEV